MNFDSAPAMTDPVPTLQTNTNNISFRTILFLLISSYLNCYEINWKKHETVTECDIFDTLHLQYV
jgi:hypothetical protein